MANTTRTVAVTMPPSTPVPMARWLAPVAMASGTLPRTKVNEVVMMGRKRSSQA